jgi:ATP-dependent DNA helicase HFM1/MER3
MHLLLFTQAGRQSFLALVEVAIIQQSGGLIRYGLEWYVAVCAQPLGAVLHESCSLRILSAKAWEDRPIVLRQIDQIGDKS